MQFSVPIMSNWMHNFVGREFFSDEMFGSNKILHTFVLYY